MTCDIYEKDTNFLMTRKQIGEALEYSKSQVAINKIHKRNKERLDKFSVSTKLVSTDGKTYDVCLYTFKGIMEICRWSKQPKANAFMDFVWEVMNEIKVKGYYDARDKGIMDKLDHFEKLLLDSGVLRTNVNPRYTFDRLNVRYKIATNDDNIRGFYDSIGNYFGMVVPYSSSINVTVKDWILSKINIDDIQEFIVGIETGNVVKSKRGYFVNLNGFGSNRVEWKKIVESFGKRCAYCGADTALIPEHIVPQSVMSKEHPEKTDLIQNITCACGSCNGSKGKQHMETWFRKHRSFTEPRLRKIQKHIQKYEV